MRPLSEFLSIPDPPTIWLIDPYVSRSGITFIHGRTSIGKSPLTWEMARCMSLGIPFLGWNTTQCRVLYVEADTPSVVVRPRLRLLPEPQGDWWIDCVHELGLDIAEPNQSTVAWLKRAREIKPEAVFWNTLRSLTRKDLSKGETVSAFYTTLRVAFPNAAHIITHHNRKESTREDAVEIPEEDHSGSSGWRDIAQIALHLRKRVVGEKSYLSLEHTKTQGSPMMSPTKFTLDEDGTTLIQDQRLAWIRERVSQGVSIHETEACRELNISRATYFRLLAQVRLGA